MGLDGRARACRCGPGDGARSLRPAYHAELQRRRHHPGDRGGRCRHRQEHHRRPSRQGAGHDVVCDTDDARCLLRGFPRAAAGARFRGGTLGQDRQGDPGCQCANRAGQRPARPPERHLRRTCHTSGGRAQCQRSAVGRDPAATDAAERPPCGLPLLEHADTRRPRQQREPHVAHHPAHRPGQRRGRRGGADAERLGERSGAHHDCAQPAADTSRGRHGAAARGGR